MHRLSLSIGYQSAMLGTPDTVVMTTDGTSGYGSVDHNYRIAKYDVTVRQYVEFLNAKDATVP